MSHGGFLVVNKPPGPTSHDIVARARRTTGIKRIGHGGTLDPPARGVLVLALASCTRLLRYVQDMDKEYVARLRFGVGTSTLDATGEVLKRVPMPISRDRLEAVLIRFVGEIQQVPPMVSAVRVGGKRLYQLARQGQQVDRPARPVEIYDLSIEDFETGDYPAARLRIRCSRGTYIRSLALDLAAALGGTGHVEELTRTRVGIFTLDLALPTDDWESWRGHLLPPESAVAGMDRRVVTGDELRAVRHGRPLPSAAGVGPLAIVDVDGALLAVYRRDPDVALAEVVLA